MASTAMQKGRLRQQLLNSELDINGLNEPQEQMPVQQTPVQQMPMGPNGGVYQQQQYGQAYPQAFGANVPNGPQSQPSFLSSYESLSNQGGNEGARKGSITSQSNMSMNKLFRRNKGDGGFDEDTGADINDLTNGSNVSFDDISHIRDRGPYGVNGPQHLDSTPFIPTIGGGIGSASGRSMTNIQYRKQMNHQKKMAYASNARAMSLAGSNPMQQPSDPRAMSLSSFGNSNGPRAMSLNSNGMMSNGPRAMSLNNRMQMPPPGKGGFMPQNGPRTMSMRNNGAQFTNGPYMQPAGGPRAMSLTNGPPGPRAMSLTNGNPMNQQQPQFHPQNMQQMQHIQQMQHMQQIQQMQQMQQQNPQQYSGYSTLNPNARAMSLNGGNPLNDPRLNLAGGGQFINQQQRQNMPQAMPSGPSPNAPVGSNQNYAQKSNDSLMNVLEEEEENAANSPKEIQAAPSNRRDTNEDNIDDDDVVYKFDEHDDAGLLSRKSTLKKSNSMKLRKLNLFNNKTHEQPDIPETSFDEPPDDSRRFSHSSQTTYDNDNDVSPSFNLRNARGARESVLHDEPNAEDMAQRDERQEKFKSLGATAEYDSSNANSSNKDDVFVTANDLISPSKLGKVNNSKKNSPLKNSGYEDIKENEENNIDNDSKTLRRRGSPEPVSNGTLYNDTPTRMLTKQASIRSLVTNTAFDKFRDPPKKTNKALPEFPASPSNSEYGAGNATNTTNEDLNLERSFSQPPQMLDETSSYSSLSSLAQSQNNANPTSFEKNNIQGEPLASQHESDQSISSAQRDYNENTTPPTTNNSNISNNNYNDKSQNVHSIGQAYPKDVSKDTGNEKRLSNIRNMNTSDMLNSPIGDDNTFTPESSKKERRSSKTFSLSNKSKNIFKRFSKSGKRGTDEDESFTNDDVSFNLNRNSIQSYNQGGIQNRKLSTASIGQSRPEKPLKFSKEELGIMNCNNELLNELQLVTTELASSIKRELEFENRLKNNSSTPLEGKEELQGQLLEKAKVISDLQDKLNKERSLRFICEEHALLAESGASPSPLKLNYEKTELYKQLLIKNDLVNQLQDKIEESQRKQSSNDSNLLFKYNELLEENTDLKLKVIPDLEKRIEESRNASNLSNNNKLLNLINSSKNHSSTNSHADYDDEYYDEEYDQSREHIEISTLKNQREELREVVSKLSSSYNYELKLAQEKIRNLELKVQGMNSINNKLSQRLESNRTISGNQSNHNTTTNSSLNILGNNKGGKLQGFAIVSPTKKLFDE